MTERPDGHERQAAGADLVVPALAIAFTGYFFVSIAGLGWEAKANGVAIGTVLLALVAVQLVRTFARLRTGEASLSLGPLLNPWRTQIQRLVIVALLVAFVATIDRLGTILGLILGIASMMAALGVRDWRWLVGLPGAVAATIHLMFVTFLGARLPAGPIEGLLAGLSGGGG